MNINIIKNFRQAKRVCYSRGRKIGSINKFVYSTFGPIAGWAFYNNSGDLIGHCDTEDEAFEALLAWNGSLERAYYSF